MIANHVLFYCEDVGKVCQGVSKILNPGGRFLCSTYGSGHMQEVSLLSSPLTSALSFPRTACTSASAGKTAADILSPYFGKITWQSYEDELIVTDAEPLISYILSCHGNQNQYLPDRYKDFAPM